MCCFAVFIGGLPSGNDAAEQALHQAFLAAGFNAQDIAEIWVSQKVSPHVPAGVMYYM